jgi:5-methylcytosine-specific restriction endonuclease McrA
MARWQGTTTQRGLGYTHQQDKKRAHAALQDGDPCSQCGGPMDHGQELELDHLTPRVLGGIGGPTALAHKHCNRAAGARLRNKLRPLRKPRTRYNRW